MGFIDFLKSFFEESEEELLDDIKEAEKLKKEAEKKLRELRKRRKKQKTIPTKYKVISVIAIILILALGYSIYKYKTTFHFKCNDKHPCEDCDAVVLCPQFEEIGSSEHFLHLILENRKNKDTDCSAHILMEKDDVLIYNKTVKLGKVPASQQTRFKISLLLPGGNSKTSIEPICEW